MMVESPDAVLGEVVLLWRYPVKSMMGEERIAAEVTERGLVGDRAYALVDVADGRIASAKSPRKYGQLFDCRTEFLDEPIAGSPPPPVRITLPDGRSLRSDRDHVDRAFPELLGREVRLVSSAPENPRLEEYWPDIEGLPQRDAYTDKAMLTSRHPPSVGKSRQEGHPEFGDLSGHVAPRVPGRIPHQFAVSGRRVPRPVPGMPARRRRARTGSTSQTGDRGRTSQARPRRWRRSCRRRRGASEGCS